MNLFNENIKELLSNGSTLKALSWKEPYASLMLHGKIETRTWKTDYRGLVLICASASPYSINSVLNISGKHYNKMDANVMYNFIMPYKLNSGYAFAIGQLVDCRPMKIEDEEQCFVKFQPGLFCHIYESVTPIKPLKWKGKLGFTNVPKEFINQIEFIQ